MNLWNLGEGEIIQSLTINTPLHNNIVVDEIIIKEGNNYKNRYRAIQ